VNSGGLRHRERPEYEVREVENKQKYLRGSRWRVGNNGVTMKGVVVRGAMQQHETRKNQKNRLCSFLKVQSVASEGQVIGKTSLTENPRVGGSIPPWAPVFSGTY
jgi:hypothetical protein